MGTVENSRYTIEVSGTPDGCKAVVLRDSIKAHVTENDTDYNHRKLEIVAHLSCKSCTRPQRVDLCRSIHTERDCELVKAECPVGTIYDSAAAGDEPFQCYAENGHYPPDLARRIGKVCVPQKTWQEKTGVALTAKKMRGHRKEEAQPALLALAEAEIAMLPA